MLFNYSHDAMKAHHDLLTKVNPKLPNVITETLIDAMLNDTTKSECLLRVTGRTLLILEKISDSDYNEFNEYSKERIAKVFDIIVGVDAYLLFVLKQNILDVLSFPEYSTFDVSIHLMLDVLYLLGYITSDEYDKAYKGGADGK